ncbi:glycosyltransferase [Arthrobacter sp. OV608]|uniref:glycosyltransferase n=1 Tax=Arthrobacter sp. OV608 TaxID=1882768 RepID=UPI0008B34460|nr:glycosyltransferase [Arthrobacter sp. OV608]SEQ51248.1 Glycosyltransferase involved in cell wall bisynthesis [Arthrobacter sp. OV608]
MSSDELKILVVPNSLFFPPYLEDLHKLEKAGDIPRSWVHNIEGKVDYLDQRLQTNPSKWRRLVYKRLPMWVVQVLETYRVGRNYDAVFLWSVANVTLVLAMLLRLTYRRMTVVALFTRIMEPKKARLLKLVHRKITRIILPPITQREALISQLGVPAEKIVGLPWTTDSDFWHEDNPGSPRMMISAAGGEMRDYQTLVGALAGTGIKCHIAGVLDTDRQDWWNVAADCGRADLDMPANVTFGTMPPGELRELYAKSRFVVVPLKPTNSDNGITCMNEAWSMGLPVIVSQVDGQRGAFVHGVEGLWVPPENVDALREAILSLWNDPAIAAGMGAAGRRLVETGKTNHIFSDGLNRVLADAARRS